MNGIFGLSKREAEMYSFVLRLDTEWSPITDRDYKDVFSTDNRKLIINECNVNKTNLSRFIRVLKDKGLITINEHGGYEVPGPISLDLTSTDIIEVTFTLGLIKGDEGTGQNT